MQRVTLTGSSGSLRVDRTAAARMLAISWASRRSTASCWMWPSLRYSSQSTHSSASSNATCSFDRNSARDRLLPADRQSPRVDVAARSNCRPASLRLGIRRQGVTALRTSSAKPTRPFNEIPRRHRAILKQLECHEKISGMPRCDRPRIALSETLSSTDLL